MGKITLGDLLVDFEEEQDFYVDLDSEHSFEWLRRLGHEFTKRTVPDEFLRMEVLRIDDHDTDPTYKFITLENNIPMYEEETESEYARYPYWGIGHV